MAHNKKANNLKYDYALYERLITTPFNSRLHALWLVISWRDKVSDFHAAEPTNEKLRSPYFRRLPGCSQCRLLAEKKSATRCDAAGRPDEFRHERWTATGMKVHEALQVYKKLKVQKAHQSTSAITG